MPRHVPASVTELSRIGLLAELPGERLAKLAARMRREELGPGAPVVAEGEGGERFYVVLAGMLSVTQSQRGVLRVLKPGDYFGEVALAMDIPRTASVSPITPVTLASCDRETFDEFIWPLFADDRTGQAPSDSS
jgi:CRP-like cAMP-binding protein